MLTKRKINQGVFKNVVIISRNISNFGAKAFSIYSAAKILLSEDVRWIIGQQLTVDGGRTVNITG